MPLYSRTPCLAGSVRWEETRSKQENRSGLAKRSIPTVGPPDQSEDSLAGQIDLRPSLTHRNCVYPLGVQLAGGFIKVPARPAQCEGGHDDPAPPRDPGRRTISNPQPHSSPPSAFHPEARYGEDTVSRRTFSERADMARDRKQAVRAQPSRALLVIAEGVKTRPAAAPCPRTASARPLAARENLIDGFAKVLAGTIRSPYSVTQTETQEYLPAAMRPACGPTSPAP